MAIFKEDDFLDEELIDIFISRFRNSSNKLRELIDNLDDENSYVQNLDEMFRIFHNLKATSSFLESTDVLEIAKLAESVVSLLQKGEPPVEDRVLNWLEELNSQFEIWSEDFEADADNLTPLNSVLRKDLAVTTTSKQKPVDVLKDLNILYVSYKEHRVDSFFRGDLKAYVKSVYMANDAKSAVDIYKRRDIDIILTDIALPKINGFKLIQVIKKYKVTTPIIIITALNNIEYEKRAKLLGVTTYISKSLEPKEILIELYRVVNTYFIDKKIKIINQDVLEVIEKLPPMPDSVFEIDKICSDRDSSIHDLIKAVKKDPIISATILKTAKSPLFGFKDVNTVDKAVSLFGKNATKAFAFAASAHSKFKVDLSPYSISQMQFSEASQKRVSLMIKWYSKVSFHRLMILATSALIGNLGQIIISNEIKKLNKEREFKELLKKYSRRYAEIEIFNVTTEEITADILNYWELDSILSDSIRYSFNLDFAYPEVKNYAVANRVIFELVDINGELKREIPDNMLEILNRNSIPVDPLRVALEMIST